MLGLFNLIQYATGNGFWVFAGVVILLCIVTTGAANVLQAAILAFTSILKR